MKRLFVTIAILLLTITSLGVYSQENSKDDVDKIRTQSGVDPTRVSSRMGYSIKYFALDNGKANVNHSLALNLGVNRWNFSLKPELVSNNTNLGGNFANSIGLGDMKFSILNAFYVKGKTALAGSVEFGVPLGAMSSPYFSATPTLTFSYTINPSLFFAAQPQYSFSIAKARMLDPITNTNLFPAMNVLTVRLFLAKFTKTGFFFVIEPRPIYDFTSNEFNLVISPIVGKALGGGYNLIFLAEIPTDFTTQYSKQRGSLFQLGFNKNF